LGWGECRSGALTRDHEYSNHEILAVFLLSILLLRILRHLQLLLLSDLPSVFLYDLQAKPTEIRLARIKRDRDIYNLGTEPKRAYIRAGYGLRKIWKDKQFSSNIDLAKVIQETIKANEDTSNKRRRALTIGTADNLAGNT
jgi:hypothetical protein